MPGMLSSGMVSRMQRKRENGGRRSGQDGIKQRRSCSESVQGGRETAEQVRVSRIERRASRESVRVLVRPEEWRGGEHS